MGQLLVTPMLLLLYNHIKTINFKLFILSSLIGISINYIILVLYPIDNLAILLTITISISMLVTIYMGLTYASFIIFATTVILMFSVNYNIGFFTTNTSIINIIVYMFCIMQYLQKIFHIDNFIKIISCFFTYI